MNEEEDELLNLEGFFIIIIIMSLLLFTFPNNNCD